MRFLREKTMNKIRKIKGKGIPGRMILCLLAVLSVVLAGCGNNGEEDTQPSMPVWQENPDITIATELAYMKTLELVSTEEQGNIIAVTTSYCSFSYPFAMSDLIWINPVTFRDHAALEFYVLIGDGQYNLFTIWFDGAGDIPLGSMVIPGEDVVVAVSAEVYQAPDTLDSWAMNTYNAAQEIFNDVAVSLTENEGFSPAF